MRMPSFLGILLVVGVAAPTAHADCYRRAWPGTADGTLVPTRGSLFIHDELLLPTDEPHVEISWAGDRAGTATSVRVADRIARIDYEGPPGAALTVATPYRGDGPRTYHLAATWRAPTEPPRVLQYWHHRGDRSCSPGDSLMVQLDQATAAVRARWTFEGRTVEWIEAVHAEESKAVLELGKIDCAGTTIPPDELAAGGHLELVAVRLDGSEVEIRGLPTRISTRDLLTRWDGLGGAFTLVQLPADLPATKAAAPSTDRSTCSSLPSWRTAFALMGITLLLLGWHRRTCIPSSL